MVSPDNLRTTAQSLLGISAESDMPFDSMSDALNREEQALNVELSAYGYIMWAYEHYGHKCAYKNVLASKNVMHDYAQAAFKLKEDMPEMLLNANVYVTKVMSNVADLETCFRQLDGMSFPYVLYVLFAGSGQAYMVARYRTETEEILKRYPSAFDKLPDSFRNAGLEVLNANAE